MQSRNQELIDPATVSPERYLEWVQSFMERQDEELESLMAPLRGSDQEVAVSEAWLEELSEVAAAFVAPDPAWTGTQAVAIRG